MPFVVEVVCAQKALYCGFSSCMILSTDLCDLAPVSVSVSASIPNSVICPINALRSAPSSVSNLCRTLSVAIVMVATHASCVGVHSVVPGRALVSVAWLGVIRIANSARRSSVTGLQGRGRVVWWGRWSRL